MIFCIVCVMNYFCSQFSATAPPMTHGPENGTMNLNRLLISGAGFW